MQQIPEKQKKQLITLSLAGAVLLAGIVAGFLVVQNQQIVQNRAATTPISCQLPQGTCSVPPVPAGVDKYSPYVINVKEIAADGTSKTITTSKEGQTDPVTFSANPLMRYECEVVASAKSICTKSTQMNAPLCKTPDNPQDSSTTPPASNLVSPTASPNIIPGDPGTPNEKACACAADGGTLNCTDRIIGYQGEQGPGLIVINPRYTGAKAPMCFQCENLIVSDGTKEVSYDCSGFNPDPRVNPTGYLLPTPTSIRLHIANGNICRDYSIQVVGKNKNSDGSASTPISCGDCKGRICCPACTPPVKSSDCDLLKCDFDINFEGGALCGGIGKSTTVIPKGSKNYSFDFDEEPYQPSNGVTHRYKNAGVYDIKMSCNVDPSTGEGNTCTQRITIGCGSGPTTTPAFPNTTPFKTTTTPAFPNTTPPNTTTTYDCPHITVKPPVCIYD